MYLAASAENHPLFKSFLSGCPEVTVRRGAVVGVGFQRTGSSLDSPHSIFLQMWGDLLKIDSRGIRSPPTPQGE